MKIGEIVSNSQFIQKSKINNLHESESSLKIDLSKNTHENVETVAHVKREIDEEQLKAVIKGMNDFLEPTRTALKFEYHEKLKEYYVTIVNPESNEVIKEIPAKKLLDAYASMAELMGFIVDETV
ncbi:flagellar protein FlaG [Radiobacillus kanasensis]|uniref:flagellar protein FlaG n=1 Tax=Radiobacillus kanasensis TaxID=2844358 RepID=UPI001E6178B0|nr:flagellar protein FlaG [Radiobacillus kanasensis]UFT98542.1 flagellar protein FlaG [Radiobacillus kanasensis]